LVFHNPIPAKSLHFFDTQSPSSLHLFDAACSTLSFRKVEMEAVMEMLYIVGAVISLGLMVYLLVALLKPEVF
jgi:K+-transporting ATPase KdpF subunit